MIRPTQPLCVNTDLVAAEVVDGEAVIINLGNGMYYTMDKVGAEIWQLIERGRNMQEVTDYIAMRYAVERDIVLTDLEAVIRELLAEGLILADNGKSPDASKLEPVSPSAAPYTKPSLVHYTDMREVLALDPPLPELGGRGTQR